MRINLTNYFTHLALERNHTIIDIVPTNLKQTELMILCNKCSTIFNTIGHNYKRAGSSKPAETIKDRSVIPYGCPTCKKNFLKYHVVRLTKDKHPAWKGGISLGRNRFSILCQKKQLKENSIILPKKKKRLF